jgi:hypothetical protein
MTAATIGGPTLESVEVRLRDELAQGGVMLAAAAPILRHMVVNEDQLLLSDEVVARVRGMLFDVARQLLRAQAEATGIADPTQFIHEREAGLSEGMADDPTFLAHVHSLTIEASLALQIETRCSVDPVLCPLLQELVGSRDDVVAGSAMAVLAAQARFIQQHRRMALPLGELPGDLFHTVLLALRTYAGEREDAVIAAERSLRDAFDESRGRLALISRLVTRIGTSGPRALDVENAGLAIFSTALAMASGQERDPTVLSFSDRHAAYLALAMRAAGLEEPAIAKQFVQLHPDIELPDGFGQLSAERAAILLSAAGRLSA